MFQDFQGKIFCVPKIGRKVNPTWKVLFIVVLHGEFSFGKSGFVKELRKICFLEILKF